MEALRERRIVVDPICGSHQSCLEAGHNTAKQDAARFPIDGAAYYLNESGRPESKPDGEKAVVTREMSSLCVLQPGLTVDETIYAVSI